MPVRRAGILLCAAVAGVVTLWLLLVYGSANVERLLSHDNGWHADFDTFYRSAVALLHGEPIYDAGAKLVNLNPPFWTVLLAPFGLLDQLEAYRIYALLSVFLVLCAILLVARELNLSKRAKIVAASAMLLSSPLMGTVSLGQIYGLLLLALAVAWVSARRGLPVHAGVFIGLAIALKPTLAPVLLLPVAQRCWPMLRAAIVAIAGVSFAGMVIAGPAATFRWLAVLRAESLSTFVDNASLPSFVARMGGPAWLGYLGAGALFVVAYRRIRRGQNADLALWSLTASALLLSPIAWHNYLVLCYPGVLVLLRQGRTAVSALLLTAPLIGVEWGARVDGTGFADHLGSSLYCFILLTYWGALTVEHDRDDPGEVRQPRDLSSAEHGAARTADQ
jgi:hypothetical protein